jgi:hypothetical protein
MSGRLLGGASIGAGGPAGFASLGSGPAVAGAASVPAFDPASLSGMLVWYRSDLVVEVAGTMVSMTDKSASLIDATIPGGNTGPTYNATDAAFGGHPSITTAALKSLQTASDITYGPFTIVHVGLASSGTDLWQRSATGGSFEYCFRSTGASINTFRNAIGSSSQDLSANWGFSATARTIAVRYNGITQAGHTLRINGANQALSPLLDQDPGVGTKAGKLALYSDSGGTNILVGSYAEWLVFNRALTDDEMEDVEGYLRSRYGHY